jgi:uncharacterized RDD family membrane protein YckC
VTERGARYAGLVTRCAALAVDGIVLVVAVPAVAVGAPAVWASVAGGAPGWLKVSAQIVASLIPLAYFTLSWWATGQSIGGLVFGVVVRRDTDAPLGITRSLLRAFIGLLLPLLWLIGLVNVLVDERRRALHDRLMRTVVVRKASMTA